MIFLLRMFALTTVSKSWYNNKKASVKTAKEKQNA